MCECLYAWSISFSLSVYLSLCCASISVHVVVYFTNKLKNDLTHTLRSLSLTLSLSLSVFACQFFSCFYVAVLRLLMLMLPMLYVLKSVCIILFLSVKKQSVLVAVWVRSRYQTIYLSKHIHTQTYMRIHTTTATHLFVCVCFSFSFSNSRIFRCVQIRCVVLQTISEHIFTAKKAKYQNSTHIHTRALIHTQWKQSKRV